MRYHSRSRLVGGLLNAHFRHSAGGGGETGRDGRGVNLASRVFWGSSIGQVEFSTAKFVLQLKAARDSTEGTVHLMHGVYA